MVPPVGIHDRKFGQYKGIILDKITKLITLINGRWQTERDLEIAEHFKLGIVTLGIDIDLPCDTLRNLCLKYSLFFLARIFLIGF